MFEKALDQVWYKVDPQNTGYISPEVMVSVVKISLEQAGYGQYYNEGLVK